jgi:excisionase family DNA binding protein
MGERDPDDLIDVRQAAALTARHPETVRRWVWSGRLPARRQGNRLLMTRRDVMGLAGARRRSEMSLGAWADRVEVALRESARTETPRSAADLILEDRERREADGPLAGR